MPTVLSGSCCQQEFRAYFRILDRRMEEATEYCGARSTDVVELWHGLLLAFLILNLSDRPECYALNLLKAMRRQQISMGSMVPEANYRI